MRKKLKKIIPCCLAAVLMIGVSACGKNESDGNKAANTSDAASDLQGEIMMSGSTSMEKLANAAAEIFMEKNGGVTVTAEFTGSSAGIEAVQAGSVDIGNASRNLEESEVEAGIVENIVAIDGIVVLVNPHNKITDLSKQQLTDIYAGKITNWSEVGGADEPIVVVGREAGSGTRSAFEEILEVVDQCAYALELDSAGTVMAKVAATSGAIGYGSLDIVDDTVSAVKLDGVEANAENIKAGEYFFSRPFVMATMGDISEQEELVQKFFEYIYSEEGSTLVEEIGLIAVE